MKLVEYIKNNGDFSFDEKKFNEVDKLILANLSYVHFKNIFDDNSKRKLSDVAKDFVDKKYDNEKNIMAIKGGIDLFKLMAKTRRYKDLLLYNYVRIIDSNQQFSALTIEINKDLVYVSVEGTADEMIGWEEDFTLSYKFPIKSQKSMIKYLNKYFTFRNVNIIIGGHSKGGNLALVGSMYSNIFVRHKIKEVYSYDGPGLLKKQLNSWRFRHVLKKFKHVVPCNSMIGMMLYSSHYTVIKSKSVGILSHFALNWQVLDDDLDYDILRNSSLELHDSIIKWMHDYNNKQKKAFVSEMFGVFKKNKVYTLLDFMSRPTALIKILSDSTKVSRQTSIMFRRFVSMTRKFLFKSVKETIIK